MKRELPAMNGFLRVQVGSCSVLDLSIISVISLSAQVHDVYCVRTVYLSLELLK